MEFPSQVAKRILFYFQPNSETRSGAVYDHERAERTFMTVMACVAKRETPPERDGVM